LNSKQLDVSARLPVLYKEKELELRNIISQSLERGKIDISIFIDTIEKEKTPSINQAVVKNYYEQLKQISGELSIDQILPVIMRLPDTLKIEKQELDEKEWEKVKTGIKEAIYELISFRNQEGKALQKDIHHHVNQIRKLLDNIGPYEKERIGKIKTRINHNLSEFLATESIDQNRFEQEMIYYLEKFDITEEKVRLRNHCDYFLQTLKLKIPAGKKLGFIAQEMGREINTIGSKANDSDIQKLVVQMKDKLEKIKEQLLNVL
ncbi:MAG: YicC family protein, partial [Bacteroidales bacterium]|nr:YicC family protein [Bacteroidales bacterium]